MKLQNIAICAAVIIVILAIYSWWVVKDIASAGEQSLSGVWSARDDEFCEAAEIQEMTLHISEPVEDSWPWGKVTRSCMLVIMPNKYVGGFYITYTRGYGFDRARYNITAELDPHEGEELLWSSPLRIIINPLEGQMVIIDALDEVVASLTRDNMITAACQAEDD
jgi:hypothetical protein